MNWTNNAKVFNLVPSSNWNDISSFNNNQGSTMFITVTDNSMYDRYHENDTVQIKVSTAPPDNSDCLILKDDQVIFRNLSFNSDDTVELNQTWPEKTERVDRDNIKILGYAVGILRT